MHIAKNALYVANDNLALSGSPCNLEKEAGFQEADTALLDFINHFTTQSNWKDVNWENLDHPRATFPMVKSGGTETTPQTVQRQRRNESWTPSREPLGQGVDVQNESDDNPENQNARNVRSEGSKGKGRAYEPQPEAGSSNLKKRKIVPEESILVKRKSENLVEVSKVFTISLTLV